MDSTMHKKCQEIVYEQIDKIKQNAMAAMMAAAVAAEVQVGP